MSFILESVVNKINEYYDIYAIKYATPRVYAVYKMF
jgi:hypothetical protein